MGGIFSTAGFEDRSYVARNMGGLQEQRTAPTWQIAKKLGPQSYNHKALLSWVKKSKKPGNEFFPIQASR